jgi:hypothetical protein
MSGIIGQGSKSGVIGLDNHDAYKHSWNSYGSGYASITSATFDFSTVTIGSGITESAGVYTVSVAGTYLISAKMARGNSATGISFYLFLNDGEIAGTNLYAMGFSSHEYIGSTGTWVRQLTASTTIHIEGTGYTHGAGCQFSGIRIGA